MQRDAMRKGVRAGPQHRGRDLVEKAESDLSELSGICNPKVTITDYQDAAEAKTVLPPLVVRGPAVGRVLLHAKGVKPDVLSFWGPEENGVVQNDFLCVGRTSKRQGARARVQSTSCSTRRTPTTTSSTSPATRRRRTGSTRRTLLKQVPDPEEPPAGGRAPRPVRGEQELLQLSVAGQRFWDDAWSKFKAG
jgi:hypothetical protein